MSRRARVIETLSSHLEAAYGDIANRPERAAIGYFASWGARDGLDEAAAEFTSAILESLEKSRGRSTTTGGLPLSAPIGTSRFSPSTASIPAPMAARGSSGRWRLRSSSRPIGR